jgi:hypothetical protein
MKPFDRDFHLTPQTSDPAASGRWRRRLRLLAIALTALVPALAGSALEPLPGAPGSAPPDFDLLQQTAAAAPQAPLAAALEALDELRLEHPGITARWDPGSGSPDLIWGFAAPSSAADPEAAARDWLAVRPELFGVFDPSTLVLDPGKSGPALGGHRIRFRQVVGGVPVHQAGIGVILDSENRVRAVSGPYFRAAAPAPAPLLSEARAVLAADRDLAAFSGAPGSLALQQLLPSFELIEAQLGALLTLPHPELVLYPAAEGLRPAWSFLRYSRNPFGLFRYLVDAERGVVLVRRNLVRTQLPLPLPVPVPTPVMTADYFPTSPPITPQLQDDGAIVDADGLEVGRPLGMLRVELRKFDLGNRVTGANGRLTGTHAIINNALPTQLPFLQAPLGTWHFATDAPPLEARPDERDHLAEPAEHLDEISQFLYITSLIEYLDYLHREGDRVHSQGVGEGAFPDAFPNDDTPLTGTVHIANVLAPPTDPADPDFLERLLGLDNAFAIPVSTTIAGQEVVVNPTFYGHGFLFNDLAIDFAVPLHEGTHATITPIAGFEGAPEGGALNEGQADLFAYTIGENDKLGAYIANAPRLRQLLRDRGVDPDSFQFLRTAQSQLRYSQLGTFRGNEFEVHQDGEIYAGVLWDLRELMHRIETGGPFVRPDPVTGQATTPIPLAKETWERLFLGSMYVLGTLEPDTFVRARDAFLIADAVLYPEDPLDPATSGRHRALIEQVFAARELGTNAAAPVGGRQTISTSVSAFTAGQERPPAPQQVTAEAASPTTVRVRWQPVAGAFAYQVLKREVGATGPRLFPGVLGREYLDGDDPARLSGFTHVEFTLGGDAATYVDRGQGFGPSPGLGLPTLDFEYVVRSLQVTGNGQVGFSDLSGTAPVALKLKNVTGRLEARIANVSFEDGIFAFDQTLTSATEGGTVFTPITFKIVDISEPSVTVRNADNGGSGQNGDEARFLFAPSLEPGQTSAPRRLEFDNPLGRLFTVDAVITGRVAVAPKPARGSQPADGEVPPAQGPVTFHFVEEFTGLVPVGTAGGQVLGGVDHVDVPFVARDSALSVTGTMTVEPDLVGLAPDVDLELRDAQGNILDSSGNLGGNEQVSAALTGGETYIYRVVGFLNGPTVFRLVSDQTVTAAGDGGVDAAGGATTGPIAKRLRLAVDPLSGTVSGSVVD